MAILWDDLPLGRKGVRRHTTWYGCPYAVPLESWERGTIADPGYLYGRCGGPPRGEGMPCWMHGPRPASAVDVVLQRAVNTIRRQRLTLADFRALTDDHVDAMRNVGAKVGAVIREARDTWDDERLLATFELLEEEPPPSSPDPAEFWKRRHDIFQVVGG